MNSVPKLTATLNIRNDDQGAGFFGAPRGDRRHNGIDYAAAVGSHIIAPISGIVTKLGYPYSTDLTYRYVEITQHDCPDEKWGTRENYRPSIMKCHYCGIDHLKHRFFYILPLVEEDQQVVVGEVIGSVQDLTQRYPGITPHVHYEIKQTTKFINPSETLYP